MGHLPEMTLAPFFLVFGSGHSCPAVCEFGTYYTASTFYTMGQMGRKSKESPPKL